MGNTSSPLPTLKFQWSQALIPAALAGLVVFLLTPFFLGVFGLGMVLGGILAVVFYRWRAPLVSITPALGAKLGALSGMLGFVLFALLMAFTLAFGGGDELREALRISIERSSANTSDPAYQQAMQLMRSPQGPAIILSVLMVVIGIITMILTSLGGALGAALLRRKPRE